MKNILKNKGTVILSFVLVVLSLFISFFSLTNNTAKADTEPSSENELTCFDDLVVGKWYKLEYDGSGFPYADGCYPAYSIVFDSFLWLSDNYSLGGANNFVKNSFGSDVSPTSGFAVCFGEPSTFDVEYEIFSNNVCVLESGASFIFKFKSGDDRGTCGLEGTPNLDLVVQNFISSYDPVCPSCGEGDCLDHFISEVAPTEDTLGSIAHYHCDSCGKNFSSEDLSEIADVDLVIPKLEHNLGEWVEEVPATDTEDGTLGHYECSNCHKYFGEDFNEISDIVIPCLSSNSSSSADNGLLSLISVFGGVGLIIGISVLLSKKKKHRKK